MKSEKTCDMIHYEPGHTKCSFDFRHERGYIKAGNGTEEILTFYNFSKGHIHMLIISYRVTALKC